MVGDRHLTSLKRTACKPRAGQVIDLGRVHFCGYSDSGEVYCRLAEVWVRCSPWTDGLRASGLAPPDLPPPHCPSSAHESQPFHCLHPQAAEAPVHLDLSDWVAIRQAVCPIRPSHAPRLSLAPAGTSVRGAPASLGCTAPLRFRTGGRGVPQSWAGPVGLLPWTDVFPHAIRSGWVPLAAAPAVPDPKGCRGAGRDGPPACRSPAAFAFVSPAVCWPLGATDNGTRFKGTISISGCGYPPWSPSPTLPHMSIPPAGFHSTLSSPTPLQPNYCPFLGCRWWALEPPLPCENTSSAMHPMVVTEVHRHP